MSILGWGDDTAPGSVRAAVIAASLAVLGCFGLSHELAAEPLGQAEVIAGIENS